MFLFRYIIDLVLVFFVIIHFNLVSLQEFKSFLPLKGWQFKYKKNYTDVNKKIEK